uniref:Uncharacterized protein n=1 Tax=Schistosoma haematobium TaxID=6185 RepID=A0A094ZI14_SCHHA
MYCIPLDLHHTIEYYILYEQGDHGPAVKRCYPSDLSDVFIERIIEFAFCCDERLSVEEFVIVFTDAKGILEFVFCYQPNERFLLCISSKFPWCECFHSLLSILWHHGLYRDVHWSIMEPFFSHLSSTIPPRLPIDRIQCANPFNPSMLTFGAKFTILFKTVDKVDSVCLNFCFIVVSDSMILNLQLKKDKHS